MVSDQLYTFVTQVSVRYFYASPFTFDSEYYPIYIIYTFRGFLMITIICDIKIDFIDLIVSSFFVNFLHTQNCLTYWHMAHSW